MRTCVNYHRVAKNKQPQSTSRFNLQMRVQLTSGTSANWRNNIVSIRAVQPEQTQKNETVLMGQTINQSRGSQRDVGGVHARCERNHQDAASPTNSASRGRSSDAAGRERFRGDGQWGGWGEGWSFAPGQGQPQRGRIRWCVCERAHARSRPLERSQRVQVTGRGKNTHHDGSHAGQTRREATSRCLDTGVPRRRRCMDGRCEIRGERRTQLGIWVSEWHKWWATRRSLAIGERTSLHPSPPKWAPSEHHSLHCTFSAII